MKKEVIIYILFAAAGVVLLIGVIALSATVAGLSQKIDRRERKRSNSGKHTAWATAPEKPYDWEQQEDELPEPPAQADPVYDKPEIIIRSKSVYEPIHLEKPLRFPDKTMSGDIPSYLIFDEKSIKKLRDTLDWGRKTEKNTVEQGGILLGSAALYDDEIYCFVKDILLAKTAGSPAFVEFTREMWRDMQNRLAEQNAGLEEKDRLVILGWFHTHPNNLSVFMSDTDMMTQRLNFSLNWQASLVMNPHRNKYRVFFGRDAAEGNVAFLKLKYKSKEGVG